MSLRGLPIQLEVGPTHRASDSAIGPKLRAVTFWVIPRRRISPAFYFDHAIYDSPPLGLDLLGVLRRILIVKAI